jgi:hypothetical protein
MKYSSNKAGASRNPLLLALVLHHFEEEIYFVRPPLAVQRVIFGALARIARLLGYRAEYSYPTQDEARLPGWKRYRTRGTIRGVRAEPI